MMMNLHESLQAFSEWLDGEGLIVADKDSEDKRTHAELVSDFVEFWESNPTAAPLLSSRQVPGSTNIGRCEDADCPEAGTPHIHSQGAEVIALTTKPTGDDA